MGSSLRTEALRLWTALPATMPGAAALARCLADWPATSRSASRAPAAALRPTAPPPLPVLHWLSRMTAEADGFGAEFVKTLCGSVDSLDWRQTYTLAEAGAQFLNNYGWAEILGPGPRAAAAAGTHQISCGVLVLGPNTLYPPHCHEAEEIYLPLSGTAEWRQGSTGAVWRRRSPGSLIHHSSEELHAMRTGDHPLLAMYLWRSVDLHQEARLDRGSGT